MSLYKALKNNLKKDFVFSPFFWEFSRKNKVCDSRRRSQSLSRLCKTIFLQKVTALSRLEFWWFWIQIFIKQIWVAATEICLSQDKVSAWIGRSPMVLKNPGWDICSCYPDLGSFLLRFGRAYGMFRIDFSGKLVIYCKSTTESGCKIAVLVSSQVTAYFLLSQWSINDPVHMVDTFWFTCVWLSFRAI